MTEFKSEPLLSEFKSEPLLTEFKPEASTFEIPRGYNMSVIKLYFWVGLVSAVLLRAIIIADHYSTFWAKAIWYLGVTGYLWFFMHRHHIAKRRFSVIRDLGLLEKVRGRKQLSEKDLEGLYYLLWSISVSKERANYMVITVFSVIAIIVSLSLDLGVLKL
ncbi:hypothetical protein FTO70_00510 [Methanosarcina sp. KYL-1]|uniref:hypothetical protein n=1 Tax=Methanosarcina sp. KYL-1 TaxID=2602068 RepID=UPI0021018431|nr:hypothetical protein [Methanosarcina sp. KYL-1]MCQ1534201.1 hypothetical protein [Methanosarcina sp. KYL-1]